MKVIFLDHDGVVCLYNNYGTRHNKMRKNRIPMNTMMKDVPIQFRLDNFDEKAKKVLNKIIKESDAEIVISSDWKKHATLEELQEMYKVYGIIKGPIGMTARFTDLKIEVEPGQKRDWLTRLEYERAMEIKAWLKDHPQVTNWVAVDDLYMAKPYPRENDPREPRFWGLDNFVWVPSEFEGIKQTGIKEKILAFFA